MTTVPYSPIEKFLKLTEAMNQLYQGLVVAAAPKAPEETKRKAQEEALLGLRALNSELSSVIYDFDKRIRALEQKR